MNDDWLIRFMDDSNGNMIAAYHTKNPAENLKTFYFCKEHSDIDIKIPHLFNESNDYDKKESGRICGIEVGFGNKETYSHIDVWLEDIY